MGFLKWLTTPIGTPEGLRWVTLHNGRRVQLDSSGRLRAGVPPDAIGVHIRDLGTYLGKLRKLRAVDCEHRGTGECDGKCPLTFASKEAAFRELVDENPQLRAFLDRESDRNDRAFMEWLRNHRRGGKPRKQAGDGRFDLLNEKHDLHGVRAISSWYEAVYVTLPSSRRWRDLPERLALLSEATGLDLVAPNHDRKERATDDEAEACERWVSAEVERLKERGRGGRLDDEETPF